MYQDFGPQDPKPQFLEPEPPPRRRLRGPLLILVVMALSAGGLWVAYNNNQTRAPGDVPVIQADQGTTKTRPQQPGGMAIPDQDKLVYNQGKGSPQVEKLLPPPEIPLPRPAPTGEAAPATPAAPAVVASPAVPPPTPPSAAPATAVPLTPPPATTAPAVAAAPPPAAPPAPGATITGYRLQLGALRSEEAARHEWEKLKKANGDLLGTLNAAWPRADLGERGIYYRIQAGPIGDAAAAERLCGELKRRNVGCILVRP
jgi:cell division septation protein DedD